MAEDTNRVKEIKAALDDIAAANDGILRPKDVVAAAKSKSSPLHKEFTWKNDVASQRWREHEARHLITRYYVIKVVHRSQEIVTPYYVRAPVKPANQQGYTTLENLNRTHAREVMLDELRRAAAAIDRARRVTGALDYFHTGLDLGDELQKMLERIIALEATLRQAA